MVDLTQARATRAAAHPDPSPQTAPPIHREPLPPAGWYVDPYDADRRRWWSGTEWTGHVRTVLPTPEPAYVAAPAVMNVRPVVPADTRASIRDLAADLSMPGAVRAGRGAGPSHSQPRGTVAAARQTVPWYEKPERNPVATAGFVFGLLAVVANPLAVMSVFALLLGAVGLAKSGGTFREVGRRRAGWAIALGIVGGIAWGVASGWVLAHPDALASLGVHLS